MKNKTLLSHLVTGLAAAMRRTIAPRTGAVALPLVAVWEELCFEVTISGASGGDLLDRDNAQPVETHHRRF